MSPAEQRAVPIALAELAVEVEGLRGTHRLLESTVNQSIQVLTTLVQNVQAEQERAREDRMKQIGLLQSLNERAAGIPTSAAKVHELQLQVSYWRGVVMGFGLLATMVTAGAAAWVKSEFQNGADARAAIIKRVELLEHRP